MSEIRCTALPWVAGLLLQEDAETIDAAGEAMCSAVLIEGAFDPAIVNSFAERLDAFTREARARLDAILFSGDSRKLRHVPWDGGR